MTMVDEKSALDELPQLVSATYGNSFDRVVVSLCNELWEVA